MRFPSLLIVLLFIFTGCSGPSAEEMFNKGVDAQKAEQYDAAIDAFQELINTFPDSSRTPEASYAIGLINQNYRMAYHDAIRAYKLLLDKFPDHATASNALFNIGYIYHNYLKNLDSARIVYEDFIKRYPSDILVASAKFELDNLGKDPEQVLKEQMRVAERKKIPPKKGKQKGK